MVGVLLREVRVDGAFRLTFRSEVGDADDDVELSILAECVRVARAPDTPACEMPKVDVGALMSEPLMAAVFVGIMRSDVAPILQLARVVDQCLELNFECGAVVVLESPLVEGWAWVLRRRAPEIRGFVDIVASEAGVVLDSIRAADVGVRPDSG